jgi:hypothetical protein
MSRGSPFVVTIISAIAVGLLVLGRLLAPCQAFLFAAFCLLAAWLYWSDYSCVVAFLGLWIYA